MCEKLLSVIVPSYNMEQYLGRCLDSLITASSPALAEAIIVNDGSKDGTLAIARDFQSRYPGLFAVIDKPNGNYGSCINAALKIAKGKYIKILDADDFFDSTEFERYLNFLTTAEYDLVLTDYQSVSTAGEIIKDHVFDFRWNESNNVTDIRDTLLQMHSITWRTENLRSMGYHQTEGISYTDSEWGYFPLITVNSICHFRCTLYKYTVGRPGQTMEKAVLFRNMSHNIRGLDSMLSWYSKQNWHSETVHILMRHKLLVRASGIYATYLIYGNDILNISELEDLDKRISKDSPEIYRELDHCTAPVKFIKCRFIRDWHNGSAAGKMKLQAIRIIKRLLHR